MGGGRTSSSEMRTYYEERSHIRTATNANQVFKSSGMPDAFNPAKIKLPREACDSELSPHSRGIILAEDVTGSMGSFLLSLIKDEFPRLITSLYDSVSFDPHIMFMGIGDVEVGDEAPLQVTQFETDLRILEQLQQIYLEKGGGLNSYESYILPWYFAAKHVKMDCFDKRGEKGFLFTHGDEEPTPQIRLKELVTVYGENMTSREVLEVFEEEIKFIFRDPRIKSSDILKELERKQLSRVFYEYPSIGSLALTGEDCLRMASEKFHCYHIILHGNAYRYRSEPIISKWRKLMGSHVCDLSDHTCLPELVSTIMRMYEGHSKTEALDMIQAHNARRVVQDALKWHEETVSDVKNKGQIDVF